VTAPTITPSQLGDFLQTQLNPSVPIPIINGIPGMQVTIANQDLTQTVTLARRNNFTQGGSNTLSIPPLGSVTVDASKTIWGLAPAGTLPLIILPGGGQWAPSPAQVAASINALGLAKDSSVNNLPSGIAATGVPLLSNATQVANDTSGHVIAAGATLTLGPYTNFTQHSYAAFLAFTAAASSTFPFYTVTTLWTDTTGNQIMHVDSFWTIAALASGLWTVGLGPISGQSLQIIITNNDTVAVTLTALYLSQNSRVLTGDQWSNAWNGASMPAVPGFSVGAATRSPANRLLIARTGSLAASATSGSYILPLWSTGGQLHLLFDGTGSNNWAVRIFDAFTGYQVWQGTLTSGNFVDKQWIPARTPYYVNVTNNGSVTGTYWLEVTAN
jgi:hypothetical protein